jgi:eukaryotic-like serine/threonine-protein kinase
LNDAMPPVIGMRFGRYELLDKLGAGGMGEVYRARDLDLGRDVAVKFLPEPFAAIPDRLGRFAQEARAASSLNHPNIVTIHEIGETAGLHFTVMELVEGGTLRHLIRNEFPFPARRVLDVACQMADGLAGAHAAGIVHRDLKPENVMLTRDGYVKILDFGLAKLRGDGGGGDRPPGENVSQMPTWPDVQGSPNTAAGVVMGTVGYMSPEQARGRPVDHRSDQFALGAMLYEMVSGHTPFQRESPVQTLAAIIEDEPAPLKNPAFPAPARWIVERCLAKDPAERYASTLDLARELRSVRQHLSEVGSSGAAAVATAPMSWRWRHRLRPGHGLAAAGALGLGLILLALARDPVRRWVDGRSPLPAEKRVAVLPIDVSSPDPEDRFRSDGLVETLTARLAQLEPYHAGLSVIPASDVRQAGVTTADAARRTLGATLVVAARLARFGNRLRLDARLVDGTGSRVLRRLPPEDHPLEALSLQEGVVEAVAGLLELKVAPGERHVLQQGNTAVGGAYALYLQARGHLQRFERAENVDTAISLLQKALEQDPGYALAYAGLGEAYWRLYELQKRPELVTLARDNCRKALGLNGLLAPVYVTLGMLERGTGRPEAALADLQRALDRDPRSADALREMGRAHQALGRPEQAEKALKTALGLRPSDWATHNYLGAVYLSKGRLAEAEAEFRRVVLLTPDNPRGYTNLGAVCYQQGRLEEAEAMLRRSVEIRPTAAALSNLGTTRFFLGRYEEAAQAFEKAVELSPRDASARLNLGRAYFVAPGMREKSRAPLGQALALLEQESAVNPREAGLIAGQADAHAMLGHAKPARALSARAVALAPDDADVLAVVASVDETLGDRTAALQKLSRAIANGYPRWEIERDPSLEALRRDPRFADVLKGVTPTPVEREKKPQ